MGHMDHAKLFVLRLSDQIVLLLNFRISVPDLLVYLCLEGRKLFEFLPEIVYSLGFKRDASVSIQLHVLYLSF